MHWMRKLATESRLQADVSLAPRLQRLLLVAFAAIFFIQSFSASQIKSPTWDEAYHFANGLLFVEKGRIPRAMDHTPLLREMSGLFLHSAGIQLPAIPEVAAELTGTRADSEGLEYFIGNRILMESGPDRVLLWARLPLILLNTAFIFVIFLFGRELFGSTAALGAAFLYSLNPTILANSFLVGTDSGVAVFTIVFLLALWKYLERPGLVRMVLCGLAMGCLLGTKYSSLVLLPVSAVLVLIAAQWPLENPPLIPQAPPSTLTDRLRRYGLGLAGAGLAAFVLLQYIYLFPKDPLQYLKGLALVNGDHTADAQFFLAGRLAHHFNLYFVVAYLVKEPIATIILAALGLAQLLRREVRRLAVAFLLIPAAALFLGYTILSDDLGVRYIVPCLPFAYLAGGLSLAAMLQSATAWKRGAAALLCIWLVVTAVGIYPDHLSYFNEAACLPDQAGKIGLDGGSRCGGRWLDESNIDWGQGLKQLKSWLDRNAPGRNVRVAYFGSFDPQVYGIPAEQLSGPDLASTPAPGLYAVSAHWVASAVARYGSGAEWLHQNQPLAVVGHAYYIYEIPPPRTSNLPLRYDSLQVPGDVDLQLALMQAEFPTLSRLGPAPPTAARLRPQQRITP